MTGRQWLVEGLTGREERSFGQEKQEILGRLYEAFSSMKNDRKGVIVQITPKISRNGLLTRETVGKVSESSGGWIIGWAEKKIFFKI